MKAMTSLEIFERVDKAQKQRMLDGKSMSLAEIDRELSKEFWAKMKLEVDD